MRKNLIQQLLLLSLFLLPNFAHSQLKVWGQCVDTFLNTKEAEILRNKISITGESTPAMFSLDRKVTASERNALEKYLKLVDDCYLQAGMSVSPPNPNNIYIQLKDGRITLAEFALESLKRNLEAKSFIENSEKSRKEQIAVSQVTNLSCLWESGPLAGTEKQFQINETAKTIWSSSGAAPSDLDFGPTMIRFRQGTLRVEISRSTGRFTIRFEDNFYGGKCDRITERKF